jgi:hypothetical protein
VLGLLLARIVRNKSTQNETWTEIIDIKVKVKVKQFRYRPVVAQRVPRS